MRDDEFETEVTQVIPLTTMRDLVFGEGYASIGSARPTRDLRPLGGPRSKAVTEVLPLTAV